jgi:hypothetical protein
MNQSAPFLLSDVVVVEFVESIFTVFTRTNEYTAILVERQVVAGVEWRHPHETLPRLYSRMFGSGLHVPPSGLLVECVREYGGAAFSHPTKGVILFLGWFSAQLNTQLSTVVSNQEVCLIHEQFHGHDGTLFHANKWARHSCSNFEVESIFILCHIKEYAR